MNDNIYYKNYFNRWTLAGEAIEKKLILDTKLYD